MYEEIAFGFTGIVTHFECPRGVRAQTSTRPGANSGTCPSPGTSAISGTDSGASAQTNPCSYARSVTGPDASSTCSED